jgi:hypothetical protein
MSEEVKEINKSKRIISITYPRAGVTIGPRKGEKYIDENEDFIKNIELCMRGVDEAIQVRKAGSAYYFNPNFDTDPDSPAYEDRTGAEFLEHMEKLANEAFEKERAIIQEFIDHMGFDEQDDRK